MSGWQRWLEYQFLFVGCRTWKKMENCTSYQRNISFSTELALIPLSVRKSLTYTSFNATSQMREQCSAIILAYSTRFKIFLSLTRPKNQHDARVPNNACLAKTRLLYAMQQPLRSITAFSYVSVEFVCLAWVPLCLCFGLLILQPASHHFSTSFYLVNPSRVRVCIDIFCEMKWELKF